MNAFTQFLLSIFQLIVLPVETIFHTDIGERRLSGIRIFLSWLILIGAAITFAFMIWSDILVVSTTICVALLSIVFLRKRLIEIRMRYDIDEMMHSQYSGTPKLFPKKNVSSVKMYWEPLVVLLASGFLFISAYMFYEHTRDIEVMMIMIPLAFASSYFACSSVIMFINEQMEYSIARGKYLDAQDEMIESKQLQRALNPENKNTVNDIVSEKRELDASLMQGFSIPGPLPKEESTRRSIAQIYDKLNPKLKDLMAKQNLKQQIISKTPHKENEKEREI